MYAFSHFNEAQMNRKIVSLRKWMNFLKWRHRQICQKLDTINFRFWYIKQLGPSDKDVEEKQRLKWHREETGDTSCRGTAGR